MNITTATISELQTESDRLQSLVGEFQVRLNDATVAMSSVRAELARRTRPQAEPRISDHALLRYIERVLEIDIEDLRSRIMTDNVKAAILAGAASVIVAGARFKITNNTIVTVLEKTELPRMKRERRPEPQVEEGLNDYFAEESQ